jgi:hypothetical protein
MSLQVSFAPVFFLLLTVAACALVLGVSADAVERALFRKTAFESLGPGLWCNVAMGGGAVGGLVAFNAAAQTFPPAIAAEHHLIVIAFSVINIALVAILRWIAFEFSA